MSKSITVSYEGNACYDILIENDFERLAESLRQLGCRPSRKACIVTDTNVASLYLEELKELLNAVFEHTITFTFPAGEENKNLDTVQKLYQELISNYFDRHDLLIAFGGGVVGDLTGFTAATYLRGVDFIQIPTTLLSQVDSSIGGKTGVDFLRYKNMVGAFYQPRLVYMNLRLLRTLPKEQFASGMAEIIKHGLIQSSSYFSWLRANDSRIMALQPDTIEEMVYQSCRIKQAVVERDPKEKGERALLNFGHTVGHAVEKLSDYRLFHGQCVAVGIAAASRISRDFGHLTQEVYDSILQTLNHFHLPVFVNGQTVDEIWETMRSDKKMSAGKLNFILLQSVGNAYIHSELTDRQIQDGIASVLEDLADGGKEE